MDTDGFAAASSAPLSWDWCDRCNHNTVARFETAWYDLRGARPLGEVKLCMAEYAEWRGEKTRKVNGL